MSSARGARMDLTFVRGDTFSNVLRLGGAPYIYKLITGIAKTAPARVTAVGHGLVAGWSAAIVSVKGMVDINAQNSPPKAGDFHPVTVIDADTVDFNDINAADFSAYVSGGYLQFFTPADLSGGASAQLVVKADDGTTLLTINAVVDNTAKTITFTESATATAAMTWTSGTYEAKVTFADATVKPLAHGNACVED